MLNLRLIDVLSREVRIVEDNTSYVALSYVWGGSHRNDIDEFWKEVAPGSKNVILPDRLPQTIEDAMVFTGTINQRYLWVDAYCINQMVEEERRSQIANMHLVFECAFLTVAAMDGQSADAGLCGVSRSFRDYQQPQVKTSYGEFMATYVQDIWACQGSYPWETRAWTFQELLLSRRVLFFNEFSMSLRCSSEFFSSILRIERGPDRPRLEQCNNYFWENGFDMKLYDKDWSFLQYDTFVANYTRRTLSNQNDALFACEGAFNQITANTGVGFVQGMPRADFHLALLWKSHHECMLIRREHFPSWSWTGWIGRIEHHYCLDDLTQYMENGQTERRKHLAKKARYWTPQEQSVMENEEAFITVDGHSTLRISSQAATVNVSRVRSKGHKMKGLAKESEQSPLAVGDHWAIVDDEGQRVPNEIGEVARFESIDYSFQVCPHISKLLEHRGGKCDLLFIKYFPFLGDSRRRGPRKWVFDYVGCLILDRKEHHDSRGEAKRIGFVFLKLEDWIAFDQRTEVVCVI